MYFSIHVTTGVMIGQAIANPIIAFVVGLFSHFALDLIPHRDGDIPTNGHSITDLRQQHLKKMLQMLLIDATVLTGLVVVLIVTKTAFSPIMLWAVVGAVLPDLLQLALLFKPTNQPLQKFNRLHNALHYSANPVSIATGHLTQALAAGIMIYLIL